LHLRRTNLAGLLARRVDGIFLSDFEQGEIGPDLFHHACLMSLEGPRFEAQRPPISRQSIAVLDQGQEPETTGAQ